MPIREYKTPDTPVRSSLLSWAQFVERTCVSPSRLGELIDLGWIEPVRTGRDDYLFRPGDARRVRKVDRICRDFEVNCLGATIIVDLVQRIEDLETRIRELNRLL